MKYLLALTLFAFSLNAENVACPDNILLEVYPDQNACELFHSIPHDLQQIPYAIYPICKGYDTARFNFNKRFNIFPHAIFTPRCEDELVHLFKKLKKHHLKFSLRSGGHCIEPGSLTSGYVVDMRHFDDIIPDVEHEEVYVGAGCRLGKVINTIGKLDYAIPTGTCTSVGVTGLTLGGGLGVLGRIFGLTCDSVKSIRLLTADGKIIDVDHHNHPDLFWALRGAGNGSYGIVIGFTFKMHYVPHVSTLRLSWKWDRKTVHEVFDAWQCWIKTLPGNISSQLQLKYLNNKLLVRVVGLKVGKSCFNEWKKAFKHLRPKVKIETGSYLDSAPEWADRSPFPFFKSKSQMLNKSLSHEPINTAIDFFEKLKAEHSKYYAFFELEAMGGKIPDAHTAFFPRRAESWWYEVLYWDNENLEQTALHKLRTFQCDIAPYVSKHAYANIVDYDIHNYLDVYYGNHVNRLMHIKRTYDPHNLFHWRQSIPTCEE